ncbi:acyl-[ACP]--phospholipid O-acyltransferase [Neptuniibacter sp. QD37_11]|uniref:acyl-[ACP]--phospholipid O-acyltransferase n=1 Tax=Neptuniibacter sp. QD37_11 TaxID=3398209 RepID=UPI0039F4EACF
MQLSTLLNRGAFILFLSVCFINAFVDVGHKALIQSAIFKAYDGDMQIILTAVINGLILLPFILLFWPAGSLGDRYPKNQTLKWSALAAVGITAGITVSYMLGNFWLSFGLTFLLAAQSALYSPAKYGYIRELLGQDQLSRGNGAVQAVTTIAILLGLAAFAALYEWRIGGVESLSTSESLKTMVPMGLLMVGLSVIEWIAACKLPDVQPVADNKPHDRQGVFKPVTQKAAILWSVLGLTAFWSVSQLIVAVYPSYIEQTYGMHNTAIIQMIMALAGLGIVVGSVIVSRTAKHHIETGFIPIGALGFCASLVYLPGAESVLTQGLAFFFMGVSGAWLIVPFNALIQFHSDDHEAGQVLASNNLVQNIGMVTALGLTVGAAMLSWSAEYLIYAGAVVALITCAKAVITLPHALLRFVIGVLMRQRYKLIVDGFEHMPREGGLLLVGNHISWIDWALIQLSTPRPVRFVMEKTIYNRWYLKWVLDIAKVIPVSSGASKGAISAMTDALNAGEVVCIFPEGAISRNGHLGEFKKGAIRALENAQDDVKVMPFYLGGLWGSGMSRAKTGLMQNRQVESLRREVYVTYGQSIPASKATLEGLKQSVFELSEQTWEHLAEHQESVPHSILKTARKRLSQNAIIDTRMGEMTYRRLIGAAYSMMPEFRKTQKDNIGLLVPTSSAGVLANVSAMMAGKTVINMNYTASSDALKASLDLAEVDTIVTSRQFMTKLTAKGMPLEPVLEGREVIYLEDVKERMSKQKALWNIFVTAKLMPAAWMLRHVNTKRPAAILFSSGSEGTPKGVMLSHTNLMANVKQISDVLNTQTDDRVMNQLPIFHAFGYTACMLMPLIEGMPMITHPDPTDAVNVGKAVAKHRATIMCATSTFLRLYTKNRRVKPLMFDSLRIVVSGAERLAKDVRDGFEGKFHKQILEGYGMTEGSPVVAVNLPNALDTSYWVEQIGHKNGSVGMPLPGTSIRVVDYDTNETLPVGEEGHILVSGPQMMEGYLNLPEKTAEVFVELDGKRFYKTMDKGRMDADGFITIVDRYSRFCKSGGEMISLSAVEAAVQDAVGLNDELIIAASAKECPKKGEKVVLCHNGKNLDTGSLLKRMTEAGIPSIMQPSEWIYMNDIPTLGTGKVDHKSIKTLIT